MCFLICYNIYIFRNKALGNIISGANMRPVVSIFVPKIHEYRILNTLSSNVCIKCFDEILRSKASHYTVQSGKRRNINSDFRNCPAHKCCCRLKRIKYPCSKVRLSINSDVIAMEHIAATLWAGVDMHDLYILSINSDFRSNLFEFNIACGECRYSTISSSCFSKNFRKRYLPNSRIL